MGSATVTVLFCDLVESTALRARLGDDDADQLRRACFAGWRDALTQHRGREVKNQGDGLMVAFASTADALAASVAIQQATAWRRARWFHSLRRRCPIFMSSPCVPATRLAP
ncbi:MAG: hypothetical protein ACT4OX_03730 [Actinomycetota bacterium]